MYTEKEKVNYNLKDFEIFNNSKSFDYFVWIPDSSYIVIGRSNNSIRSVKKEKAALDNIKILKRPSGGEAVILSPKTLVISLKFRDYLKLNVHEYFKIINKEIIDTLKSLGVEGLNMKGISDISIRDKKILGSSLYKRSEKIFYHAVLNVSESISLIERYLKYPEREPDYRMGRKHIDFVTSIKEQGYNLSKEEIQKHLDISLSNFIKNFSINQENFSPEN